MSDINTNISVNIDTSGALAQLKALQKQISTFHTSIAKSSQTASLAQADLQKNFLNAVNGIGAFSAELRTVKTSAENFTSSLEKNKFSMREYFRYAGGATQTFGRLFKSEFETINKVATENVKNLQTQYIKMGRDANGAMKAIAVRPLTLDMQNLSTQTQIAAQKQALFNQIVKQGSTNLLNFGKNTQWAGRQLMVGFTLPLMALGTTASKTFMDMEAAALKFKKVYGDLFTAPEETQAALDGITELAKGFTKYGIAVSKTVGLASEAAAAGFAGLDLQRQTTAATKLSVLGQIEQQQALETTISLQNAMGISSEQLAESIDFLNAVENQTVTSLDDITIAIPKVAPVIKSLGGDVKDLAFFMTAMKEGGINASEGANALKSGLASMINPSKKASGMLADMGINIKNIVEKNQGNLRATVVEFAQALDKLDPLSRARAIEQMFGKFQFARLSTLFQNVIKDGTQAERVLQLAGSSVEELAALSDKELGMTADSAMNKFRKSVEDLKLALVPVGKVFLEVITPFLEKISGLIEKFNGLSDSTKKIITVITVGLGAIAPVILMTVGLLANFVANGIKGLMILRNGYLRLTGQSQILGEQTNYLTTEQQQALAAAHSLEQSHARLTQAFTVESTALGQLKNAYIAATTAANNFAMKNPGMMVAPAIPTKRATGKPAVVGGTGNKDSELALLTPGETVIPAPMSEKYGSLINGMIADNIPGYKKGKKGESVSGTITKDPSTVKKDNRLYAAPKIIDSQTTKMAWLTLEAELEAVDQATRAYLQTTDDSAEQIQLKIDNLQRVQASHINKEVDTKIIAGESLDIKQWNAPNLQADLGAINNFLNVVPRIADTLDDSKIAEMAGKLNITVDEFKTELSQLQQGIHPTTEKSADVLLSLAKEGALVDPSTGKTKKIREELKQSKYQSIAAEAALTARKEGDYYATLPTRAYDPSKDIAVAQDVANRTAKTQQALLSSFNISDEIAQISGKNAQALQNAWNALSVEQKEGLLRLKDDANAFTAALLNEAKEAGVAGFELGDSAIQGISKGIQDGSPSKKAKQKGKNVTDGFEQGILEGMDDASIAGSQVGNAAVDSLATTGVVSHAMGAGRGVVRPQGAAPIGPATPNTASLLPLIAAPLINANQAVAESTRDLVDLNNNQKAAMQLSTSKLASMNKTLNSATFALTAMAGAGSMFGGKIGEVSNQIFKYSGLIFGLMQITQLLTQAKAAELLVSRAANAGLLVQNINTKAFSKTPGLFAGGIKKLLPNLLRFGGMIARFLGPIGLAITAITLTVGIINRVNAARERERLAIEGLGDAALLSKEKIKNLGEFFGIPTTTSPFRSQTAQVKGTTQERSQIDALKETENFKKDYKNTIASLKTATDEQAALIFDSLSVQLRGSGFAKEQIELIISALKEESGKTNVEFDFKKLDLTTDKGILNFQQTLDQLSGKLASSFSTGYSEKIATGLNAATGELETWTQQSISKALKKDLHLTAQAFTAFIDGISGQLANGTISADQFNQAFARISSQIAAMPQPQAMLILNKIMQELPEDIRSSALGLKNVSDRMLILQAQAVGLTANLLGVVEAMNLIANPTADISDKIFAQMRIDKFKKDIQAATKAFEDFFATKNNGDDSGAVSGEKGLSGLSKKVIEGLKKELKLLEDKKKALQEVNDEIERQQEFQQKQQELDADITQAKISGNYIQAALLGQQKLYNKSQYDRQTAELALDKQIQQLQDRINALEDGAKVTALDKKLANVESAISDAATKNGSKTSSETSSGKDTKTNTAKQEEEDKKAVAAAAAKKAAEAKKAELEAKMPKLFKARVKDIPPYNKYLEAVLKKHKYNPEDWTVAFDIRSQMWKEFPVVKVPNEYVSVAEWLAGNKTYTQTYATGGHVKYFGPGGDVSGPGTATSDSIPAYLSNGEYVIKAASVNKYGTETFDALNAGRFAIGGIAKISGTPKPNTGGSIGVIGGNAKPAQQRKTVLETPYDSAKRLYQESNKKVVKIPVPPIRANFATNSYDLNKEQREELQKVAKQLLKSKIKSMVVQGHADSRGGVDNDLLSLNRARATAAYLAKLVPGTSFIPVGHGIYKPLAPNTSPENMALNRRAELFLPDQYKTIYPDFNPKKHTAIITGLGRIVDSPSVMSRGVLGHAMGGLIQKFAKGGQVGQPSAITKGYRFFKDALNSSSNPASSMLMGMLEQAGTVGQTALNRLIPQLVPAPSKKQNKDLQEFSGIPSVYRSVAGKTSESPFALETGNKDAGKWMDYLTAAGMFLPIKGTGAAAKPSAAIRPSTASATILRNLKGKALEFAKEDGRNIPEMVLSGQNADSMATSTLQSAPKTDLSKAYHHYWGEAYSILSKQNDDIVKGLSKEEFLSKIASFGTSMTTSSFGLSTAIPDFLKSANKAYVQAHGLNPNDKISLFKATRDLDPKDLGGYFSLSSKFAAAYLDQLGVKNPEGAAGLYKLDLLPEQFAGPISIGAKADEFTTMLPPELVSAIGGAKRIATHTPKKITRASLLSDIYSIVPGVKPPSGMKMKDVKSFLTTELYSKETQSKLGITEDYFKKLLDAGVVAPKDLLGKKAVSKDPEVQALIDSAMKWNSARGKELSEIEAANPDFLKLFNLQEEARIESFNMQKAGKDSKYGPVAKKLYGSDPTPESELFNKYSANNSPYWEYIKKKYYYQNESDQLAKAQKFNITPAEVTALRNYLEKPLYGHLGSLKDPIEKLVQRYEIPQGMVSYRALSNVDLQALSGLNVGESFISPTVRSITNDRDTAAKIAAFGGTGGDKTRSLAKIIFGSGVKGIDDISKLGENQGLVHEGLIANNTRFILEGINKASASASRFENQAGIHQINNFQGSGKIITEAIDEYILRAVKMKNGGMVRNKIAASRYKLPSYEVGSSYIPQDQIAQLHKGERVLTAEENKNFTASGPVTNIININGSDLNKKEIAEAVMVELDRTQKKNNKTNMVNK